MNLSASKGIFLALLLLISSSTKAAVIGISEFSGSFQESWESFPTLGNTSPLSIMGGKASLTTSSPYIYNPSLETFSLGLSSFSSGSAQVADGTKGLGLDDEPGVLSTATIDFTTPITQFGGYWGAATGFGLPDPAEVSISFYDQLNNLIDTATFNYTRSAMGDGLIEWHGWSSSAPISSITYEGYFVANDHLQASATVPLPASIYLFGAGLLWLLSIKRKT